MKTVVSITDLPPMTNKNGVIPGRFLLEGSRFGLDHLTLILGETAPGGGNLLHRHDYEELFIVHSGRGTYIVGGETVEAGPGDVVLIPPGVSHRFVNHGDATLFHTSVHSTGTFSAETLD